MPRSSKSQLFPLSKGAVKFNPQMQSREEITVPGKTLDTFCQEQNIIEIDILKMDIQGGELLALRGARKMLSEKRIHVLYLEVEFEEFYKGQPLYHHLVAHLENFGYEMYSMTDISLSDKGKWLAGDAIFVKK